MPITEFLERNAREFGAENALTEINPAFNEPLEPNWKEYELVESDHHAAYRKEMSWQEFDQKANRLANFLISRGLGQGDKVAILLMNCLEWLPIYFGILKAGATVVPMNYRYTAEEIKYCLELADVTTLIFGPEFVDRVEAIKDDIGAVDNLLYVGVVIPDFAENYEFLVKIQSPKAPGIELHDGETAAIYFSSGTTGFPKAILHNHDSLVHACKTEQAHHGQTREDVFLCIPPLYHTGAKMHWFGSLISGSPAVLLRGTRPEQIIEAASTEKASIVWLLVPWAQDILDAVDCGAINLDDYDLSRWRLMHIGAQPVPTALVRRWRELFPHHAYDTNYGLSESIGPGAVHLGVDNFHKAGAIGIPGYGWEARIVDENAQPVASGQVGELTLKGPGIMTCYYKNEEATAEALRDGWLFTGDMAKEDEDGFIYLVDRKKDVIIMGGENIYPVQIEDFLRGNDKIKDVAVIGLPDDRLGEISAAIIELKEGMVCTEGELREFCDALPRYKRPRAVIFDKVPRNPTGKIEKPKLREKYVQGSLVEKQIAKEQKTECVPQVASNF